VNGQTWQARTAVALVAGAVGLGICGLLAVYVSGAFVLLTLVVAIAVGWRFGPVYGGIGAGVPPVGIAFVGSDSDYIGERILAALFVVLLLGGTAWVVGRVRERYGHPPWGRSTRVSR
jgi:hypothetical protein